MIDPSPLSLELGTSGPPEAVLGAVARPPATQDSPSWVGIVRYLAPFRARLAAGLALLGATALMDLLKPWPLKLIFDHVLLDQRPIETTGFAFLAGFDRGERLLIACVAILLIAVVGGVVEYFAQIVAAGIGQQAVATIKRDLFAHIQRLSLGFHRKARSGELLTRLVRDAHELRNALSDTLLESVGEAMVVTGMIAVLVLMDVRLALVGAAVFPALAYAITHYSARIRTATRRQRDKESRTASIFSETLATIDIVQVFAGAGAETARFERENRKSLSADLAATRLKGKLNRWVEVIVACGTCLVMWRGTTLVLTGQLTPGDLIVFAAYLKAMYKPIRRIAANLVQISRATVGAERVMQILGTEPLVRDLPGARPAPVFHGEVEFRAVGFEYEPGRPVLADVSFHVVPGSLVAIVGESGAGKSTVASLIPRLYDPTHGAVLVDGLDIRDYTVDSLRAQISIATQESVLVGLTIRENIAYGDRRGSQDRIVAAAKDAGAHGFIERLPKGYDTVVGERGATLSGGQRQRLAVARALYRDARILILDEPATGLDIKAETHLLASLARVASGRTTFLIAHRFSAVVGADLILVLQDGRLVEAGTHQELVARRGRYSTLLELQARTLHANA